MTYYRGGLSAFGRRFRGSGLGADAALVQPSLTAWTEEDARMLDILGSKGTGSPEGQALIKEIEATQGAGNWYNEWVRLQDYYTQKYLAASSDASRLTTLQTTTTQDAAKMDPTQQYLPAGSVPYSIHDINAFQAMSAEEQAAFINAFTDPAAAAYFLMVAGPKPEAVALIEPSHGGNLGVKYMGADGTLYNSYEEMVAAGNVPKGTNTVTTSDGTVIQVPQGTPIDVETVFGPGSGTSTVPQWTAPTAPAPITNPYTPTTGTTEGGVPQPAPITPPPVIVSPPKPSGTLTPTTTAPTGGGGGGGTFTTETPKAKPGTNGTGTGTGTTVAGLPGGALGVLAILGIGLALFAKPKR